MTLTKETLQIKSADGEIHSYDHTGGYNLDVGSNHSVLRIYSDVNQRGVILAVFLNPIWIKLDIIS